MHAYILQNNYFTHCAERYVARKEIRCSRSSMSCTLDKVHITLHLIHSRSKVGYGDTTRPAVVYSELYTPIV